MRPKAHNAYMLFYEKRFTKKKKNSGSETSQDFQKDTQNDPNSCHQENVLVNGNNFFFFFVDSFFNVR